jgi:ElaB/YqjD/DUF883 family membrane-anchored ribosome-binding protein
MNADTLTTPSPEMKRHAQDLKEHATEGAQNIRNDVNNLAGDVKDHAKRNVQAVKDEAGAHLQRVQDKASNFVDLARAYAVEHPLHAFGVGVLLGVFLARRRH